MKNRKFQITVQQVVDVEAPDVEKATYQLKANPPWLDTTIMAVKDGYLYTAEARPEVAVVEVREVKECSPSP